MFCLLAFGAISTLAQNYGYQQGNSSRRQAFRQEIARLEITVERGLNSALPLSLVPRVAKGDLLRVRLLEEPINGIKPEDSFWDWSLVVAFVNPSRNQNETESVSREINFRRDGWYNEHQFKVPYDSQPVFFLYPKPKYRKKIKKLINKNFKEIRKIGEKTLEIADAYAQIGLFLNQLQDVINQRQYGWGVPYDYNGFNYNPQNPVGTNRTEQAIEKHRVVEGLAKSFNIKLPGCWNTGIGSVYNASNDFISRAQCVARNVRLEDFDFSVSRILQQGGLVAASKLVEQYPQLAYWINLAATAVDLILKITRKTPLKIVPTMIQMRGNNTYGQYNQYNQYNSYNSSSQNAQNFLPIQRKISLYAENPPTDQQFVTAFPVVFHKWQPEPDPELINLPTPRLFSPCLHAGQNLLKNADISYDWLRDPFSRDFKLKFSGDNGFKKEFRLIKNTGLGGWVLQVTPQDLQAFQKEDTKLYAKLTASRGFSYIESKKFPVSIAGGGKWEVSPESSSKVSVGGVNRVIVRNKKGDARCLRSVTFKLTSGESVTFSVNAVSNPLLFSKTGDQAWFFLDTTKYDPGQGSLEFRTFGNEEQPQTSEIKLFAGAPKITKLYVHKGDNKVWLAGKGIDQVSSISVNSKKAQLLPETGETKNADKMRFIFLNPTDRVLSNKASLELTLEGDRQYKYPKTFDVSPARPALKSSRRKEVEAGDSAEYKKTGFDLSPYPVIPVDIEELEVSVKTSLTDYKFLTENLSIETRVEYGQADQETLPEAGFEVLDPANLKITLSIKPEHKPYLAGRRLQFRIIDKSRGDSDWYTVKHTFVRIPQVEMVICRNTTCKIKGVGLEYIGQLSVDGGKVWKVPPKVQRGENGKYYMSLEGAQNKRLLRIKLRDFPNTEGLPIG